MKQYIIAIYLKWKTTDMAVLSLLSTLRWLPTFERSIWAHDERPHRNRWIK